MVRILHRFVAWVACASVLVACAAAQGPYFSKTQVPGTWFADGGRALRFELRRDGTFAYKGWGASSAGRWTYEAGSLKLVWTKIDRQPVVSGAVRGTFPISTEGVLSVDKYVYRKS